MDEISNFGNELADFTALDANEDCEADGDTLHNRRIRRICFVGATDEDREDITLLKENFGINVMHSIDGHEYIEDKNIVFLCKNFHNCDYFEDLHSSGKLIIGPALVRSKAAKKKKALMQPKATRPVYTDSMSNVCIVLSGLSKKQCKDAVDLVHFMGGSARKTFSGSTTHLITESASGKVYRMAISMGRQVMHLDWLRAAWDRRDDLSLSVTDKEFANNYVVEPFCGLRLHFIAFPNEELLDMQTKTTEHCGEFVLDQKKATHLIVSNEPDAVVEDVRPNQQVVSGEWFWLSIQLNCCANEDVYEWRGNRSSKRKFRSSTDHLDGPTIQIRRSKSRSSVENLENSTSSALPDYSEHLLSTEDFETIAKSAHRFDKRHAICKEMLETEENYLKALKIIVQLFKKPLEIHSSNPDSGLLSKAEIIQIFSRIPTLVEIHELIYNELKGFVLHWKTDRLIGKIWLDSAPGMEPVYKAFINNYDTAIQVLDQCDRSKPKFHAFLKAAESRAECQRNHLVDLLVRPVQRLPSVLLLLKALLKKTERSNPDYACIGKAMKALDDVLSLANESRRLTESYAKIFRLSGDIERCPAVILSSARTLRGELQVLSLGGEEDWIKTRGKRMTVFCFNDVIEIVKVRDTFSQYKDASSLSASGTLSRQFSISSFKSGKKRYKHYDQYMLTSIRHIDVVNHNDFPGLFIIYFRAVTGENFWIAQYIENQPGELKKFLWDLATQIFYLCGRSTLTEDAQYDDYLSTVDRDTATTIEKAISYAVRNPLNASFVRPPGHLRRVMSSVQIGISNTLSRLHSRSNLPTVNEGFLEPQGNSLFTPSRRIRQMLSTSTFTPFRTKRRETFLDST